jgi:hypothetical protein
MSKKLYALGIASLIVVFGFVGSVAGSAVSLPQTNEQVIQLRPGDVLIVEVLEDEPTATETASPTSTNTPTATDTPTETVTETSTPTATETATETPIDTPTETATPSATETLTPSPTNTVTPSPTPSNVIPFTNAPACPPLDNETFHTLWNSYLGCHYDHEHGVNPFTSQVTSVFSSFLGNLYNLLCDKQINHCVPSSSMENTMKHGGHKWQVTSNPNGCTPFTGLQPNAIVGVDYAVIQYHFFGNSFKTDAGLMDEFGARVHSNVAELRQCKPSNPADYGYVFVEQWQDYGARLKFYQGPRLPYADNPPFYATNLGPYFVDGCIGNVVGCRATLAQAQAAASATIWTSQPKNVPGSKLYMQLIRGRDTYEQVDYFDNTYPFDSYYLCTSDGGQTYNPNGCKYNNSTSFVQEIGGEIPASWDNNGLDTNLTVGRITFDGYVTRFGTLVTSGCTDYGPDCQRIKLVNAFVGKYGAQLIENKINQFSPAAQPERDICFNSSGVVVNCDVPGAIPSGWIGAEN